MSLKIRRVVTGHDDSGKAVVLIDEICRNVISRRERHHSCVVWSTASFPVDNSGREDESARPVGAPPPDGTVFRIIEYGPGVAPRNHRTSTIDYAVVISGEIDMELDDGVSVHLEGGRRHRAAGHDPQLGEPRYGAVRDRVRADRRASGRTGGGQDAGSDGE